VVITHPTNSEKDEDFYIPSSEEAEDEMPLWALLEKAEAVSLDSVLAS
jgi:hypothetical protein